MCGISGAIGSNIKMDKIKLLGIANISRGEKGAGCYVNGKVHKVITDYNTLIPILPYKVKNNFVLNHTRKPSAGNFPLLVDTHPFEEDDTIFCHNGTITNLEDLEKITSIPKRPNSIDSQYLHELMMQDNLDWLSFYTGAATFVFKRDAKIYIFVGGDSYKNGNLVAHRELHYCYIGKTMYFSSEKKHLEIVSEGNDIFHFPVNKLLVYNLKGEIENSIDINRNNVEGKMMEILYSDLDLDENKFTNLEPPFKKRLFYCRGCYYFEGKPYTGTAFCRKGIVGNPTALYPNSKTISSNGTFTTYYFYNGMMVTNLSQKYYWDNNLAVGAEFYGMSTPEDDIAISQFFDTEYLYFNYFNNLAYVDGELADGVIEVPGTSTKYEFKDGHFIKMFLKDEEDFETDLSYLLEQIDDILVDHQKTELSKEHIKIYNALNEYYERLCGNMELQNEA